ncbi:Prefoldin alpha subunit [Sodiomyces alkalinus F11]|uniref:Prefoldin alpha subunit n=1 Tax=Sodiomyces alkalinus (strain CBS 110278 / VKM F-3762 / F11) TaxID=1314773 RepID=A0A3N2Q0G4_SODAK|nr:Prefoldin alpha subunit [Sodiomyces alkalinus F11]ROT40105.1 Prefoldin alpha subunit [Sodiomyces alkalinus F11]
MAAHEPEADLINLATLNAEQLTQVKKQIDEELDHLTQSFAQLHAVQGKFSECLRIVKTPSVAEKSVLVPLTSSLYVRGDLTNSKHVIVDIGTGYYIEKNRPNAERFYESKIQQLLGNIEDLEKIIHRKTANARTVENVLRQKVVPV